MKFGLTNYDLVITILIVFYFAAMAYHRFARVQQRSPYPKKKIVNALCCGEPIEPKHQRPESTTDTLEPDRRFFSDFADFAGVVNEHLGKDNRCWSWRLQETPSKRAGIYEAAGRSYEVFCSQQSMGKIQIRATIDFSRPICHYGESRDGSEPLHRVRTTVELHSVRLLGYDAIRDFLLFIACCVTDRRGEKDDYEQASLCSSVCGTVIPSRNPATLMVKVGASYP